MKDEYGVEQYVIKIKSVEERSALSKFRSGVAPINFMSYDEDAKLRFLFNDDAIVSKYAKTCLKIINIRSNVINYVR